MYHVGCTFAVEVYCGVAYSIDGLPLSFKLQCLYFCQTFEMVGTYDFLFVFLGFVLKDKSTKKEGLTFRQVNLAQHYAVVESNLQNLASTAWQTWYAIKLLPWEAPRGMETPFKSVDISAVT